MKLGMASDKRGLPCWPNLRRSIGGTSMGRRQKSSSQSPKPTRPGSGGKVANDVNKMGAQAPMQKNEGRRTPLSRHDRDALLGSDNQSRVRKGGIASSQGGKSR